MPKIFISYSRRDEQFARKLTQWLVKGGAEVWIDLDSIQTGVKWSAAIQDGLDTCDIMIVLISPSAVGSVNVEDEWQYYLDKDKPVIPLMLQPAEIPYQLRRIQYIDFTDPARFKESLAQLRADLKREVKELKKHHQTQSKTKQPSSHTATKESVDDLWPERPRSHYMIGGVILLLVIGLLIAGLWLRLNPQIQPPYDVPEGVAGLLQMLDDRGNSLLEAPRGANRVLAKDRDPLVDDSELLSQDSTIRSVFQQAAQIIVKPSTVVAFLNISNFNEPLSIELTAGEIFIHTGNFPGVNTIATNNVLFKVTGSNVRIRHLSENSLNYACLSGHCVLEDMQNNFILLPEGAKVTIEGDATSLLDATIGEIEPLTQQEFEEWNKLCADCLSEVAMQSVMQSAADIITPTSTSTNTPTATATATMTPLPSPTLIPTETTTPSPVPSATPSVQPTIAVSGRSGTWHVQFDELATSNQSTSPTCSVVAPMALDELDNRLNLSGIPLTARVEDTGSELIVTGLEQILPEIHFAATGGNVYTTSIPLFSVQGVIEINGELRLNFLSENNVVINLTITDTALNCVGGAIDGIGYRQETTTFVTWQITEILNTIQDSCNAAPFESENYTLELSTNTVDMLAGRIQSDTQQLDEILLQAVAETPGMFRATVSGNQYTLTLRPDNSLLIERSHTYNIGCEWRVRGQGQMLNK